MKPWSKNNAIVILIMIPMASLYAFSLDLYIPFMPKAQEYFHSSLIHLQMANSLFMLGFGFGQLICGPISDAFGRRPVLLFSMSLHIVGSIAIILTDSINVFILARMTQALGACGGYLCCFATIRDVYLRPKNSAEMFSYLNAFIAISATCAPVIAAMLGEGHPWKIVFYALLALGCIAMLLSCTKYPETFPKPQSPGIKYKAVYQNYKRVFCDINYQIYTLSAAIGIGSFFAFYCISPYLYEKTLSITTLEFGLLYGSCGMVFLLGSYLCGRIIKHTGIYKALMIGLAIHLSGCLTILVSHFIADGTHILPTHLGVIFIIFGASFLVSAGIGGTMAPFKDIAGSAFAMIGSYKFIFAEVLGTFVAAFYNDNALSLGFSLLTLNLFALALTSFYKNKLAEH